MKSGWIWRPKSCTPLRKLLAPVKISARLGVQIGFPQKARVKASPSRLSRSNVGVRISGLPNAATVSGRWSSLTIKTMFGCSAACSERRVPPATMIISSQNIIPRRLLERFMTDS